MVVLVVVEVEVEEVVVHCCLCGPRNRLPVLQGWKYCTVAPGDRNIVLIGFLSSHLS